MIYLNKNIWQKYLSVQEDTLSKIYFKRQNTTGISKYMYPRVKPWYLRTNAKMLIQITEFYSTLLNHITKDFDDFRGIPELSTELLTMILELSKMFTELSEMEIDTEADMVLFIGKLRKPFQIYLSIAAEISLIYHLSVQHSINKSLLLGSNENKSKVGKQSLKWINIGTQMARSIPA